MSSSVERQIEKAKITLGLLADEGIDFNLPRHVVYFFYGDSLGPISDELESRGFRTHNSGDEEYWHVNERYRALNEAGFDVGWLLKTDCVMAERTEVIGEKWRTSTLRELYELGEKHGVEMDGWHAQLD